MHEMRSATDIEGGNNQGIWNVFRASKDVGYRVGANGIACSIGRVRVCGVLSHVWREQDAAFSRTRRELLDVSWRERADENLCAIVAAV